MRHVHGNSSGNKTSELDLLMNRLSDKNGEIEPSLSMNIKTIPICFASVLSLHSLQAQDLRSATSDSLNTVGAWMDGSIPTTADIATWDASSTLTNTIGAAQTYGGLNISSASGAVAITGAFALTLDHATDASTILNVGATDFTWGAPGVAGALNIVGALSTVAPGNGNVGTGATFSGSSVVTLSGTGTKNWSTSGSATNGANGVTNLNFTGTLRLRGGTTAIESLGTNWLALGGGGGTTGVAGAVTQTGAFHLDTGDAASRGDFIVTHGFNSKTLELLSLAGTGSLREDWGVGATLSNRTVRVNQTIDTVFAGGIYAQNGSSQRRNLTITKEGAGKLTFIGRLGSSQATGGNPSSLNIAIDGGVWQMGDGAENPSAHFNSGNWDAASTFSIGSAGTLRFMTAAATYTWDRPLTGSGRIEITNDGTVGEGNVIFSASNAAFTGSTDLMAGSLRVGPSLGSGALTVRNGTLITPGLAGTNGTSEVGALVLEGNTRSEFRLGVTMDKFNATGTLTPPPTGQTHTVNLAGATAVGGTITLIDYTGAALTTDEFSRFVLGTVPSGAATYQLINNTANSSIDLLITLENQVWKGSTDANWNLTTTNWALASTPLVPVLFDAGRPSLFADNPVTSAVSVAAGISPSQTTFTNETTNYTLTGNGIQGAGNFTKNGAAIVTLALANTYTGTTTVNAGTLTIGDGGSNGDIGSGAVIVGAGANLVFNRDATALLDYKTNAKMRTVSGVGKIAVMGGVTFFNYPGTGTTFADPTSWANFSGDLSVTGDSEFRTIRNGASAMGTGKVILGDATTNGTLAQIEGNWTWTNNLEVVGSANTVANRSTGTTRTLKLQGVISGNGGLTLADLTAAMTDVNRGFILTGANTYGGTLTIAAGTPVRVGGVPGNVDVTQLGAAAAGSLGAATVVNEGTLTISRTDAHSVANSISGAGAWRIGIPTAAGLGNTATQVVTYTGTDTHTGLTTINNGTLLLGTGGSLGGSLVTVEGPAVLGGSGTVNAPVMVNGTISPGNGIGTLTVVGNTELANILRIDVDGATADKLVVTGNLTAGGEVTLTETGAGFTAPSYVIAQCTGVLAGDFLAPAGYTVTLVGQQVIITKTSGYETWATANAGGQSADQDFDRDGVPNGVEYFMGQMGSTFTANPGLADGKIIWPRDPSAVATFKVQISETLAAGDWIDIGPTDPNLDLTIPTQVSYTLPTNSLRKFCRLQVIVP
jgi:fibronectin-binding autotransporter adhesin